MQVHKIQNNNTSFGAKLVIERSMFPRGNMFDGNEKELLKKLISTVEAKTADKKGFVYVLGECTDLYNSNLVNIYFKDGKYIDNIILYDKHEQNLCQNIDKYIDMLTRLTDVFKMREKTIKTAQKVQKRIEKLEKELYASMNQLHENIKKTLPERKTFAGSLFEDNKKEKLINIFEEEFKNDKNFQEKVLA